MKIMKKIGALVCAAAISVSMVSAMPVGAYDYESLGGARVAKADMPKWNTMLVKYVYTSSAMGRYTSGELSIIPCNNKQSAQAQSVTSDWYCRDNKGNYYNMYGHQARVISGGKTKQTSYIDIKSWAITGSVKIKNDTVKVEAYYRYNKG